MKEKHDTVSNDGKFWMELSDVKKYIGGISVGLYLDDFKMSTFRKVVKKDGMMNNFTLKNPVTQHLVIQSDTIEIRQEMDRTAPCIQAHKDKQQPTATIEVQGSKHRFNNHPVFGGYKEWKMLPKGDYKIEVMGRGTGVNYDLNINVHAEKMRATIA